MNERQDNGAAARPQGREEVSDLELTVLMPCLNEAETIARCVAKARHFLQKNDVLGEVLVADNGSTDDSAALAAAHGARVIHVAAKGYGNALLSGIAAARGRFIIMGDADDSYDFANLGSFLAELRAGHDLVMGNRFKGGVQPGAMPRLNSLLGNPLLTGIGRLFFRSPIGDFHCGLRGFSKQAAVAMDLQTTGMEFASEMVVKATLLGMRVVEVPTSLAPAGRSRPPHLQPWRDGWRHLRFMLLYSPRWLFFYPGLVLFLAGLGIGVWLLPGPRRVGSVTFDIHTLLYAALAILLGFQAIWFAAFSKAFAITAGLLPPDPRFKRWFRWLNLEAGLVAGGVMIMLGLADSFYAVHLWGQKSFGPLEPTRTFRMIIPAVLLITLGCQVVLASFFLSVLRLGRRGSRSP